MPDSGAEHLWLARAPRKPAFLSQCLALGGGAGVAIAVALVGQPGLFLPCTHTLWLGVNGWALLDGQEKLRQEPLVLLVLELPDIVSCSSFLSPSSAPTLLEQGLPPLFAPNPSWP